MKIDLIGQALDEIKEEDQNNLSELESKEKEMEEEYNSVYQVVTQLTKEHDSLKELESLSRNTFKHIHMILPIIEIPFGIIICWLVMLSSFPPSVILGLFALAMIGEVDAIKTLVDSYPKILGNNEENFMTYVEAFKSLFLSKRTIKRSLISKFNDLLNAKDEAARCRRELTQVQNQVSSLKIELLHVDGYIQSIEYIAEKKYFDELRSTTDIVQFINKKRELKKVVTN